MQLKTRFRLNLAISAGAVLAVALVLGLARRQARRADEAAGEAARLRELVLERLILRDAYLLGRDAPARLRVEAKTAELAALLQRTAPTLEAAEERQALAEMRTLLDRSNRLLDDLVVLPVPSQGAADGDAGAALRDRLTSALLLTSHDLHGRAGLVADSAARRAGTTQQRAFALVVAVLLSALAVTIANALRVAEALERRITRLRDGAGRIGAGDLSARVPVEGTDELGDLASRFNEMASSIQAGSEALEARVRERTADLTRANDELRAQKQELEAQGAELRAQRQELASKSAEVERANQLKSQFLANMSHELRTPLNSIIGFSDLLLEEARDRLEPRQRRYVEDVLASGRNLLELINDILDLSKIEAGRLSLQLEAVDPGAALADAVGLIQPAARAKGVTVVSGALPPGRVFTDRSKLRQILLNLLSNAVKFAPERSTVEVRVEEEGAFVRFRVRDQGPGVDPAVAPRLYEPFVQGESPLVKQHKGTGLGLAICKRLVSALGGAIEHRSEPGRGAEFSFTLPAANGALAAPGERAGDAGKPLVLVVEEDGESAKALRSALEAVGYRVAEVGSGEDAWALAARLEPSAVVLDPGAERRDVFKLLDDLRRRQLTRDIPVVISSAPGAVGFVPKPVDPGQLLGDLARAAGRAGAAPPGRRVLVVDDDPQARALLQSLLEPCGYEVLLAEGGRAGLALARERRPDVAVLDLMMPDLSGFEVLSALAADPATREIPVIVLTAADLSSEDRRRLRAHARAEARKGTLTRTELVAALRRATERASPAGPPPDAQAVLVVDDNDLNRELVRTILERSHLHVLLAEDGDAGIELARREHPALIFLDLAMPGKDGFAAARELKAAPETASIPLVALTALAMRGDEERAYAAGFDGYLTKPIDRRALEDSVWRFLARGAADRAPEGTT